MSSSMHSSGRARAPSMLSWVMPERKRAQGRPSGHPGWTRGVTLTTVGHGRLKAVQRPLVLTEVIRHVPIGVDGQEVGTPAGGMDRGFGHKALPPWRSLGNPLQRPLACGLCGSKTDKALDRALKPGGPSTCL